MEIDYEHYSDGLFRFALSLSRDPHVAEDLLQDCLLKAHRARNQLNQRSSTKAWLFQIMFNLWRDQARQKQQKHRPEIQSIDDQFEVYSREPSPVEKVMANETSRQIFLWMQSLPDQQRTVLFLSVVEQLNHQQIADMLGTSRDSVKSTLSQARKQLRKKIKAAKQSNP